MRGALPKIIDYFFLDRNSKIAPKIIFKKKEAIELIRFAHKALNTSSHSHLNLQFVDEDRRR